MTIDYKQEQEKLDAFKPGDASLFWKPSVGQHKVKALTELEDTEPYNDKAQKKLKILVNGEEKEWTFAVGISNASTYGQIVKVASQNNNTLVNKEFTVVVVSDGKKNSYTIVN